MITDSNACLKMTEANRKFSLKTRNQILDFLGGECAVCGFNDKRALQVDHIKGNGSSDRKRTGPSRTTLRDLVFERGRDYYQLLCANCNWIKRVEKKEYGPPKENHEDFKMELFPNER